MKSRVFSVLCLPAAALLVGCGGESREARNFREPEVVGHPGLEVDGCLALLPARADTQPWRDSVVLNSQVEIPCSARERLSVVLRSDPEGKYPDPSGSALVMDSRGRMFTRAAQFTFPGIIVWGPDGTFSGVIGRQGDGPGEFSMQPTPFMGIADSLFLVEGGKWHVYGPAAELSLVRSVDSVPWVSRFINVLHVLDNGGFLSGSPPEGGGALPAAHYFTTLDREGRVVGRFGNISSKVARTAGHHRRIGYAGGETFWAGPPRGTEMSYRLEEWSLAGEKLRTIVRDVPWFRPPGEEALAPVQNPELPIVHTVHVDPDGLLWIVLGVRDNRWRFIDDPLEVARVTSELGDMWLEVIDPTVPRVLASELVDKYPSGLGLGEPFFRRFVPRTRKSYRAVVDTATGLTTVEVYDVSLIRK